MTLAEKWRHEALKSAILAKVPEGWEISTAQVKPFAPWSAIATSPTDTDDADSHGNLIHWFSANTEEEALRGLLVRVTEL